MAHRRDVLGNQITRVFANNCGAEDFVFTGYAKHFYQSVRRFLGNRTIQILDTVRRHFIRNTLCFSIGLVQAYAGDFRVGKRGPGDDRIVHFVFTHAAKKRIHCCIPGLVRRYMRELVRTSDIAAGINRWVDCLQVCVGGDRLISVERNAQFLKSKTRAIGAASKSNQYLIKLDVNLSAQILAIHYFLAAFYAKPLSLVLQADINALIAESV